MPSIDINFLLQLHDDYKNYPCFIETGTLMGETIFSVEPYFNKLYTIEFSEYYYNITKKHYNDNSNNNKINFILNDSSIEFKTLLPTITDKAIFFLDGHWCGSNTGKSSKDCPLEEEIRHINNLFRNEAIIIIDDYRLFGLDKSSGKLNEDWSNITKDLLVNIIKLRINKIYHLDSIIAKDDRLIIHINSM
jgi:hypothetical protein